MDIPMLAVYRYFIMFQNLPTYERLRKSVFNNSYYGHGLCEFLNATTGSNFNYAQMMVDKQMEHIMFKYDNGLL